MWQLRSGKSQQLGRFLLRKAMPILMRLNGAAPSISTFCMSEPRALGRQEKEKEKEKERMSCQTEWWRKHGRAPRCSRTNAQSSGSPPAALRPVWNWGSSSISYLLRKSRPAPAFHPLFFALYFFFHLSLRFCCLVCEISRFFCPLLILLRPPTQHLCSPLIMQRSFILSLHSSIPSKSPSILCSSLSSMSFFYLSSNFFPAILSIIQCTLLAPGFWSCMGTLYRAYQFKRANDKWQTHRLIFCTLKHTLQYVRTPQNDLTSQMSPQC